MYHIPVSPTMPRSSSLTFAKKEFEGLQLEPRSVSVDCLGDASSRDFDCRDPADDGRQPSRSSSASELPGIPLGVPMALSMAVPSADQPSLINCPNLLGDLPAADEAADSDDCDAITADCSTDCGTNSATMKNRMRCYRLNLERPFDIQIEQSPLEYGDYMAPWKDEDLPKTEGPVDYSPPPHLLLQKPPAPTFEDDLDRQAEQLLAMCLSEDEIDKSEEALAQDTARLFRRSQLSLKEAEERRKNQAPPAQTQKKKSKTKKFVKSLTKVIAELNGSPAPQVKEEKKGPSQQAACIEKARDLVDEDDDCVQEDGKKANVQLVIIGEYDILNDLVRDGAKRLSDNKNLSDHALRLQNDPLPPPDRLVRATGWEACNPSSKPANPHLNKENFVRRKSSPLDIDHTHFNRANTDPLPQLNSNRKGQPAPDVPPAPTTNNTKSTSKPLHVRRQSNPDPPSPKRYRQPRHLSTPDVALRKKANEKSNSNKKKGFLDMNTASTSGSDDGPSNHRVSIKKMKNRFSNILDRRKSRA